MKHVLLSLTLCVGAGKIWAQKPVIDSSVYGKWPSVGYISLSSDGKYTLYPIKYPGVQKSEITLQSIDGKWEKKFEESEQPMLAFGKVIFKNVHDSLCLQKLGTNQIEYIPGVVSFGQHNDNWVVYKSKLPGQNMVIRNLKTGKEKRFPGVDSYQFSDDFKVGLIQKREGADSSYTLYWLDLATDRMKKIWKGEHVDYFMFDQKKQQVAYEVKEEDKRSWWVYKSGEANASLLMDSQAPGTDDLDLGNIVRFSNDGSRIFVRLTPKPAPKAKAGGVKLNVWSYFDAKLPSAQLAEEKTAGPLSYLFVMDLATHSLIRLEQKNEVIYDYMYGLQTSDNYMTVQSSQGGAGAEKSWNIKSIPNVFLVSTRDGSRKLLAPGLSYCGISPSGKFLLYEEFKSGQYGTYEISSEKYRLITENIPDPIANNLNRRRETGQGIFGLQNWLKDDNAILFCDKFDIWQVDPLDIKAPINLTQGYGRKMNIQLRNSIPEYMTRVVTPGQKLLLVGFNPDTKENGFLSLTLGSNQAPKLLSQGPYTYYNPGKIGNCSQGTMPRKATVADCYLVTRESASEYPNYFVTTDFKTFKQVTNLQPQKKYNWMTGDLHTWKSLDGENLHGVLYKPENFDPAKKYPVIFYYYELLSDDLNSFHQPDYSDGRLNIAWYASNGYLVFTPDIHLTIGQTFEGTYNAVVSAAQYLSGLPFVNGKKIGIQGISFGGIQTNYLVTHTNIFAAACSSSGTSDFISQYGALSHGENSCQSLFEEGQIRVGSTLWERPEWYIENSPVMNAPKVTTPLLMMHTSIDGACPFPQAVEFFTDLRRLGKKVWLLEYPEEGDHGLWGKSAIDFSIRMAQFFDHYLKDKPAPVWMTKGIPSARRGIDQGYEYDTEIKTPGDDLLTPEAKAKANSWMNKNPATITLQ